jgi:hypothetical protein
MYLHIFNKNNEVKTMETMNTIVRFSPLQIPKIVRMHWNAKPKVAVNFVAEPSTVKSDGTRRAALDIARFEGREFVEWNRIPLAQKQLLAENPSGKFIFADVRASETDIGELRLQDLKDNTNYITFKYNILFEALSNPSAMGILFFDEMNLAPNMIKAQFYKIINDRAIGDIPLSDDVLCISAGNESEHARGVSEDPVPLVLRRGNYFLKPLTHEEYSDFAVSSGHHRWVIGYLMFQPNDTHNIAYDLPDGVGQPCPRTWTKLSQLLSSNKLSPEDVQMIAIGLVGQGAGVKFASYVRSAQEININEIIKNPSMIARYESNEDVSLVYAVISGVVDKFRDDKSVLKPAFEMALHFARPEFGAYLMRSLKSADEREFMKAGVNEKIVNKDIMRKVVERYGKFLLRGE